MKIGILNAGNIGSRLARAWARAGHDLVIARDGDLKTLAPLVGELAPRARIGTVREAAEFGDVVLFSVYWPRVDAIAQEIGDALAGKTVIETMNPLGVTAKFVHYHDLEFMRDNSTAEYLQKLLPAARVVKSFNQLAAPALEAAAWRDSATAATIFYCGDDEGAKDHTRQLIIDAGFVPMHAGALSSARQLEQLGVLHHAVATHEFNGDADLIRLGFAVVEALPGPVIRERVR
ncbi:NADPH-dependent F420 reductase [Pseudorhodoferax sp.]|uniref:NADPH-dependent F420 reductase n=1 Tax=Pseudorhodoferax sp. TaxID=1993553 RepID=UPI003FA77C91